MTLLAGNYTSFFFSPARESCIIAFAGSAEVFFLKSKECGTPIDRTIRFAVSFLLLSLAESAILLRIFLFSETSFRKQVISLASVNLRNGESQDSLLKRFRKKIVKSGILSTIRNKRWFVSKSETRRMEKKKAIRRIKLRSIKDSE